MSNPAGLTASSAIELEHKREEVALLANQLAMAKIRAKLNPSSKAMDEAVTLAGKHAVAKVELEDMESCF